MNQKKEVLPTGSPPAGVPREPPVLAPLGGTPREPPVLASLGGTLRDPPSHAPLTDTLWEMPTSAPLSWDRERCIGCNRCVNICQVDVMLPSPAKGQTPIAAFPGECWYCGCCVLACPIPGAIRLRHPLMNEVHWVPKARLTQTHDTETGGTHEL